MNEMCIEDEEVLYRAILRTMPNAIVDGRVTAAVFIDNGGGTSVDRGGERTTEDVLNTLRNRFNQNGKKEKYMGAALINAKQCREAATYPVPKKTKNNKFHAEIHESEFIEKLTLTKAMLLSRKCSICLTESE